MRESRKTRREAAEQALRAAGWLPGTEGPETHHTFRLPDETDREIAVHERGGLEWRYKDRYGIWRTKNKVNGTEDVGVSEALQATLDHDKEKKPVTEQSAKDERRTARDYERTHIERPKKPSEEHRD